MELYYTSFKFCERVCRRQQIDESHDEFHMLRVALHTECLNKLCGRWVTDREREVMVLAAFTHDLCDRKYTDVDRGAYDIYCWLSDMSISKSQIEGIMKIILSMSYSKVKKNGYPQNLGEWELAYHHVRIADLIDAYDIDRCYTYQSHRHPHMSEKEKWKAVCKLFRERVLKQKDEYILPVAPYASEIVESLHRETQDRISQLEALWAESLWGETLGNF
jgi:HD superfamily phosphodiesterase